MNVPEFYGYGAFDTIDMFMLMRQIGVKPVIKTMKNASSDRCSGSKYCRKALRESQKRNKCSGRNRISIARDGQEKKGYSQQYNSNSVKSV